MHEIFDALTTAEALPYPQLSEAIQSLLLDPDLRVPARLVHGFGEGASLFLMPASDTQLAITKLITFVPTNPGVQLPSIQGQVMVFDAKTGSCLAMMDGPTVTARRTAAVSLLAAQKLAPKKDGPMLIVGAGVQGRAHMEAFHHGLGVEEFWVASRSNNSAQSLVQFAIAMGLNAKQVDNPNEALAECSLVVSCTPAQKVIMTHRPRPDAFIAAVGAFNPDMMEWSAEVCQFIASNGTVVVDTRDADHEAGDLLQAGLTVTGFPSLADVVRNNSNWKQKASHPTGPVFFKSCGWAGWDLAAARCLVKHFTKL